MSKLKLGTIYQAINKINGKSYIGKTINYQSRKKGHIHCAVKNKDNNKSYFYRSIRKYNPKNFEWKILYQDYCCPNKLFDLEIFFIAYYNTFGKNGYNLTSGGDGFNSETLNKINPKTRLSMAQERGKKISKSLIKSFKKINPKTGLTLAKERAISISKIRKENKSYFGKKNPAAKKWKLTNPTGNIHIVYGLLKEFCNKNNLSFGVLKQNIGKFLEDPRKCYKQKYIKRMTKKRLNSIGWKLEII